MSNCTECGGPVAYGERHHHCGTVADKYQAEIDKLREELDAAKAEAAEMSEAAAAMSADLTKIGQERDALAATVEDLRKMMEVLSPISACAKHCFETTADPDAILAARDARVKAEALREAGKHLEQIDPLLRKILNDMADAIEKGGS